MGTFLDSNSDSHLSESLAADSSGPQSELRLTASYHTLGCKLNFAETSTIGMLLASRGITKAAPGESPDICVVNTCSVTEMADKKARSLIRRLHREHPKAAIVVTGCYAQLKPGEVAAMEGVDIVLGSAQKLRMAEYIDRWLADRIKIEEVSPFRDILEFSHSCERGDRTRFFLKVQDGCDYFCTYCTIPFARGRSRSPEIASLVERAREAAAKGGREIVLTGVNTGDFGKGRDESFFDLIRALDAVEEIKRFRISSIEPNLITSEIIDWIASESRAFMPHFHIPLQSGSDAVLKLMNRRYDTRLFADRIAEIRHRIPDAFIGVDIIAGARGETPEEWEKTLAFVKSLDISRLHVFPYSERPGTKALQLADSVPAEERHRRVGMLTDISARKLALFFRKATGTVRPVLWEHPVVENGRQTSLLSGLTDNYLRVVAPGDPELCNTVTDTLLSGTDPYREETMIGSIISRTDD